MNYNNEDLLEMVELYAEEVALIASEQELSDIFDSDIMPMLIESQGREVLDDSVMINETFSNWSDGLCKDAEIHPVQDRHYCYVGEYSE